NDVSIEFDIPGTGVQTVAPLTALPAITRPVTIDGYTQPGASPNTLANADNAVLLIELRSGLFIQANACTVRGLVLNRFAGTGLWGEGLGDYGIGGNFNGTDGNGTNAVGGSNNGIVISGGAGNRVGGLAPSSRNNIGGNQDGVFLQGTTDKNEVLGNF